VLSRSQGQSRVRDHAYPVLSEDPNGLVDVLDTRGNLNQRIDRILNELTVDMLAVVVSEID
jgi:hypothetical protein